MHVDIKLSKDVAEPYAELHAQTLSPLVQAAAELLERLNDDGVAPGAACADTAVLIGKREDSVFVLDPDDVQIVRSEGGETCLYDGAGHRVVSNRRLYELESALGREYCRISKSALVRILKIDHVDAGFGGALDVVMQNGVHENISRRYVSAFKQRIGL